MTKSILTKIFLLFFLLTPVVSNAQMFSVGEEESSSTNPFSSYARGGIFLVNFSYEGDPLAVSNSNRLTFNGTVVHLGYESSGLNFGLGFGNTFSGLENRSYFHLDLGFINPFYLIREENFAAGIPIKLRTKATSVRSDQVQDEFRQTDLSAGAGLILRINAPEKFAITTQFIPSIGFSNSSGGFLGGNIFSLAGKTHINFYNLIFGKNISLGYDYIYDSFNLDGDQYDYDVNGHLITLGVSL